MHLNWKKLSRKACVSHPVSESILASFHWSSVYAFLQVHNNDVDLVQSLLSAVTLGELLKCTGDREAYNETSLSQVWRKQYLFMNCMLVLNKLVLNRFLTDLLLQTMRLAVGNITCSTCLQPKCSCCSIEEFLTR